MAFVVRPLVSKWHLCSAAPRLRFFIRTAYYIGWHQRSMQWKEDKSREFLRDLWHRRQLLGPDDPKPRSESLLWDYEAELFAFGKRLGEDFQMDTIRRAFRHHLTAAVKMDDDEVFEGVDETRNRENNNKDLIDIGQEILDTYVPAYLRYHFRKLPEEGIRTIAAYLVSRRQLAYLARNLGVIDLIIVTTAEFPPAESTLSDTFKALVGALTVDSGEQRAEYFVQDFVLTELVDLDVNEIFYVKNPKRILEAILEHSGRAAPEWRILRQTGTFTVTPTYIIGVYAQGELIGQSPGETLEIAEEMAARDSLKTLWATRQEQLAPLSFGPTAGRRLNLEAFKKTASSTSLRGMVDFENVSDLLESPWGEDEPLNIEQMFDKWKGEIEPTLGKVYRRKFKHYFYHGSLGRRPKRPFVAPSVKTI